jgi:hypothetical protein
MTTYQVTSDQDRHHLIASWPDLPERSSHPVATFQELKLATVAKTVLNASSRYRWHRWVQLLDEGVFPDEVATQASVQEPTVSQTSLEVDLTSGPMPELPSKAILGDLPMSDDLEREIKERSPDTNGQPGRPDPESVEFTDRVQLGNLRPLLWRDWCGHLGADEHDALATELDAEVTAMTGPLAGRARQIAWYLSAELLIDEDQSRLVAKTEGDGERRAKAFQKSLIRLLADLVGLRVESTAVDWDPDNEELLRVYSPSTVVGFWLDPECWYFGWPDPNSTGLQPTTWQHAGTLPTDTSIGELAGFITERTNERTWPFGGSAPNERRSPFGGRRRSP